MAEKDPEKNKKECTFCEAYDFKGTWTCECDAINLSQDTKCWRCGRSRFEVEGKA
ncbi:MAG: hypothetical protein JXA45_04195 [Methanomassiliicoccales archaeon]|nr:hypothetical protein [Methanomassiliicoccales archaeon]